MKQTDDQLPERLRAGDATELERRLLEAAGRERPSRELSERMARSIGISVPGAGGAGGGAAPRSAGASGSLAPWISGALVVAVVAGAVIALRPGAPAAPRSQPAARPSDPVAPVAPTTRAAPAAPPRSTSDEAPGVEETHAPAGSPPVSARRDRRSAQAPELAEQIALIDAARGALAAGNADRTLTLVRKYQTTYPTGAFRPEAAALRIEALVKLGRNPEARAAAEQFVATYGRGPLADRVARSVGLPEP